MDLETENRLASLLLEEARRLQLEADREGVHAYLRKPNVRHRPNSWFLTATVCGVQQANHFVEIKGKSSRKQEALAYNNSFSDQGDGLGDEEIDKFLHSRVKPGRGAVGSRMDEPGPYLDSSSHRENDGPSPDTREEEKWEHQVQGPEKPLFLRSKSPDDYWHREMLDVRPSSSEPESKKEKKQKSEKKDRRDNKSKKKKKDKTKSRHRHRKFQRE
ncbi:hypothetical protein ACP4OV_012842 [Aristida adscensionis]